MGYPKTWWLILSSHIKIATKIGASTIFWTRPPVILGCHKCRGTGFDLRGPHPLTGSADCVLRRRLHSTWGRGSGGTQNVVLYAVWNPKCDPTARKFRGVKQTPGVKGLLLKNPWPVRTQQWRLLPITCQVLSGFLQLTRKLPNPILNSKASFFPGFTTRSRGTSGDIKWYEHFESLWYLYNSLYNLFRPLKSIVNDLHFLATKLSDKHTLAQHGPALPVVANTLVEALVHLLAESRPTTPLSTGKSRKSNRYVMLYIYIIHCIRLKNNLAMLFILS